MPKQSDHPLPKRRFHGGRWRFFWKWNYKQYTLPTRFTDKKKTVAVDADLRLISAALAMDEPEFPNDYAALPGARDYIADRLAAIDPDSLSFQEPGNWFTDYEKELSQECADRWADNSMVILRKFAAAMGGIDKVTPDKISSYLAEIAGKRSIGTRNRTQSVFSRFFRWAADTGRTRLNPMEKIKRLTEPRIADIVYCTPGERTEIIAYARETEWPEWIAVPIAFFTGMRREEIANLLWENVHLQFGTIVVKETKTKISRTIPINTNLEGMLREIPESEQRDHVVPAVEGYDRLWRMDNLIRKIQRMKQAILLKEWDIVKPPPSKAKDFIVRKKEYRERLEAKSDELQNHLERIGWNVFRHTFGSLLVQGGVSLDKVCAWMGNTPEVCRRHYAQFIPRDRR
ncbi:MAG: tyrosine-type recombinase/integrase, partial [Planctomycetota bacterium]|nr:tyrosine-type recombinase/integrase [Planctomycetota bacterium]